MNAFGYHVGMWPCRTTLSSSIDHQDSNTSAYSFDIPCFFLTSGYCKLLIKLLQMCTLLSAPTKPIWLLRYQLFREWMIKCHWGFPDFFSYAKATLCRQCEHFSVCCTVYIHFFNIWKCYFSLCLVLLLIKEPDSFWVTFLLWYSLA